MDFERLREEHSNRMRRMERFSVAGAVGIFALQASALGLLAYAGYKVLQHYGITS